MKATAFILVFFVVLPAWGDNVVPQRLVDTGRDKAVVFEETVSPDGRYAIGWTIHPLHKDTKPVDWSQWNSANPEKFVMSYINPLSDDEVHGYAVVRYLIDLKGGRLLVLLSDPEKFDFPQGGADSVWSKLDRGRRYALVQSGDSWTTGLWLITIDSTGVHQANLVGSFDKAVLPVLREKRPLYFLGYETTYLLQGGNASIKKASFTDSSATIAFKADTYKQNALPPYDDSSAVEGYLTFQLSDGTVTKVWSDTVRDDPMQDVPELAQATRQLDEVYNELHHKLSWMQWADVENAQTVWYDDELLTGGAAALRKALVDHNSAHDAHAVRDKFFLESTQKRLAVLKAQLDALH